MRGLAPERPHRSCWNKGKRPGTERGSRRPPGAREPYLGGRGDVGGDLLEPQGAALHGHAVAAAGGGTRAALERHEPPKEEGGKGSLRRGHPRPAAGRRRHREGGVSPERTGHTPRTRDALGGGDSKEGAPSGPISGSHRNKRRGKLSVTTIKTTLLSSGRELVA